MKGGQQGGNVVSSGESRGGRGSDPGTTSCWGWKQEVFRIHSKCMRDPESFEQEGDMV